MSESIVALELAEIKACRDLRGRLERLGLRHYNNWMRLRRGLTDVPRPPDSSSSPLDVREIGPSDAHRFGDLVAKAFDDPPSIAPLTWQPIGRAVTRDAPSFRNLRRLGFEVAYTRPNYLWAKAAPAS